MIYVMSDLHGCYEKYRGMLEKIKFSDADTLYILGDVVDRGDGGIKILQDMMFRKNVIPIRGNHDYLAYQLLIKLNQTAEKYDTDKLMELYQAWFSDGGKTTYDAFVKLASNEKQAILKYINSFLIFEELEVGGRKFFMAHTVPSKERMDNFDLLVWQEFIVGEPEYEKVYFDDQYIVTGHTPTSFIGEEYSGRIYMKNNHIAIDCGAVFGSPLGCICLDTLEEFYVD